MDVSQRKLKIWVNQDMANPVVFIIAVISTYLLGSIPFGFLVAKWRGVDISKVGSGNIGATNVGRNLGWKTGVLVGVLDFGKGFLPVILARYLFTQDWQIFLIAIMPVIGHIFSVWLNFQGGKGVATIFGLLGGFFGIGYFLVFLLLWVLAVWLVKLMSLVNLVTALLIPIAFWLKYQEINFVLFGLLLGAIVWWRHKENIKRLVAGKEHPINY
jgi:glycerol-3-phosphate acyltransferase PlsY